MKSKKKKKKWLRRHHLWVRNILNFVLYPVSRVLYGIRIEKYKSNNKRPHLILYNHQTAFDQFFVGMVYPGAVYYVASEDLFSNGFISKLIKFLVNPIPIKKSTSDMRAVLNCMQVAKEGGSIAIAPEGNRTFSGETGYIKPSIVSLIKALKMPVAIVKLEGGYGVHPRWSDVKRKGSMRAYLSKEIEPETYNALSDDELMKLICNELYVDETKTTLSYVHKKSAEYLERAIYYCPICGISEFESHNSEIKCKKCGLTVSYGADLRLRSNSEHFGFSTVKEWYQEQSEYVNSLDPCDYTDTEICKDDVKLFEVIPYKKKIKLGYSSLSLFGNRMQLSGETEFVFSFDDVTAIAVLGRNKLNVYLKDRIYQIKSGKRFNALKHMNFYYRYANVKKGDPYGEFLGI